MEVFLLFDLSPLFPFYYPLFLVSQPFQFLYFTVHDYPYHSSASVFSSSRSIYGVLFSCLDSRDSYWL